jgi:hypothetical protein
VLLWTLAKKWSIIVHKQRSNYLATRAKRFVLKFANNHDDPEFLIGQREIVELTNEQRAELFGNIRRIAEILRRAFETSDDYERDWLLFWARKENAVIQSPLGIGRAPGVISMAPDSEIDQNISFVQRKLAKKMAVCARGKACHKCFFKRRNRQKYCSPRCVRAAINEGELRWWTENGKRWRADWLKKNKQKALQEKSTRVKIRARS